MYSNVGESKWTSKKSTVPSLDFGVIFQLHSVAKNNKTTWIKMQWQHFSVHYPLLDLFGNKNQNPNKPKPEAMQSYQKSFSTGKNEIWEMNEASLSKNKGDNKSYHFLHLIYIDTQAHICWNRNSWKYPSPLIMLSFA